MSRGGDPLRSIVEQAIAERRTPGAAWCVLGPDGVRSSGAAGDACIEPARERVREDTPYDLASLTKPLATALAATILEREGVLDLESPVERWVPELAASPFGRAALLDLGIHRAGLPAWSPLFVAGSTRDAYVRRIAAMERQSPGQTLYSDLGYVVLGIAIERASGETLDALFDKRIAGPLGLRSTGFAGTGTRFSSAAATERGNMFERTMAGAAADGYPIRTEVIRGHVHDSNAWAMGGICGHAGLFGTAYEAAMIGRAILEGFGSARMLKPVPGGDRTFGFTTAGASETMRGVLLDDAVGHLGFTGVSLWLEPSAGRVHALLTNRIHPVVPAEDFSATRRAFHAAAADAPPR